MKREIACGRTISGQTLDERKGYPMTGKIGKVRNAILHGIFLILLFLTAVVVFERMMNQYTPTAAEGMENSTFPLVYIQNDQVSYNCLHGYAREMDVSYIRDTITVLNSNHLLDLQIQTFSAGLDGLSYEILSSDGTQSLENTNVIKWSEEGGYYYTTLEIQNKMLMNQEYILKLKLSTGDRELYYYTRILLEDGLHLSDYLDFVTGFYEKCINKTDQTSLGTYVEPDADAENPVSLARMDIHDSVNQLMWADLNPQIYYKPTPSLVDINETTASFVLEYRISAQGSDGTTELYNVKEFYRLRYTDTRIYLLDFTRSTDEIFDMDRQVIQSTGINLGITDMDVEYLYDSSKKQVAFVQENELFCYEISSGKLSRVFGFPQSENMDYRDFYDKNTIKLLRLDKKGNLWFAVSGYMNRGNHEGENGVALYYYEEASASVQEKLFIQTMESYDELRLDMESLCYVSQDEQTCTLLLEETLYRITLADGSCEKFAEGIRNNCSVVSESGRYFAWLKEGEEYASSTLCQADLDTGEISTYSGGGSEYLRPLAFMQEDLVYGAARIEEIGEDSDEESFPMYRLMIQDPDGTIVKSYQEEDVYVIHAEKTENMLILSRIQKKKGKTTEIADDYLVSTDAGDEVNYGVTTLSSAGRQTEILLRFGTTLSSSVTTQSVTCKLIVSGDSPVVMISPNEEKEELYYVYAGGSMSGRYQNLSEAIRQADAEVGVVIDHKKTILWERGNKTTTSKMKLSQVPEAFHQGSMDPESLQADMEETLLDLCKCSLEEVLYFVGQGKAVLALTPDKPVIIVGYDEYNVILLDPGTEETYYGGLNDSTALFEEMGNQFFSYQD